MLAQKVKKCSGSASLEVSTTSINDISFTISTPWGIFRTWLLEYKEVQLVWVFSLIERLAYSLPYQNTLKFPSEIGHDSSINYWTDTNDLSLNYHPGTFAKQKCCNLNEVSLKPCWSICSVFDRSRHVTCPLKNFLLLHLHWNPPSLYKQY